VGSGAKALSIGPPVENTIVQEFPEARVEPDMLVRKVAMGATPIVFPDPLKSVRVPATSLTSANPVGYGNNSRSKLLLLRLPILALPAVSPAEMLMDSLIQQSKSQLFIPYHQPCCCMVTPPPDSWIRKSPLAFESNSWMEPLRRIGEA
jgi:hypothetical protein